MALVFPNVAVLGLARTNRFFEAGFEYAAFKRISIAGTVNDLTNGLGISGVWDGSEGVLATIRNDTNYQPLILNGVNFGSGRIESIAFDQGNDVRLKGYTANLVVYDSGNLFNFTGAYYSGIDATNFPNLQSFDENWSFNRKLNGGYSYTQNATIQFISGANQLFAIGAAQSLARTLFTGSSLGFAFYPAFANKQGKRYVTESYDLINNLCSFAATFDFDNNLGAYSATHTRSIQLDEQGVVTASENGNIRGIENPNYQNALSAVGIEMSGAYARCSGAVTFYFPTGAALISTPISQGRTIDIFNNNVDYTVIFNNSPLNQRTYFWDYTLQMASQDGVSTATERGSVIGRGPNPTTAFANAQTGFGIVKPGISGRVGALFTGPYVPSTNYLQDKQESYAPVAGTVGYSYVYSNDPTLVSNAGIRRIVTTVDTNSPLYIFNKIGIINNAEIIQDDHQGTQGAQTVTVELEGDKTQTLSSFLTTAVTQINLNAPVGNDRYVGSTNYSYDPTQNTTRVTLTWVYNTPVFITLYPP